MSSPQRQNGGDRARSRSPPRRRSRSRSRSRSPPRRRSRSRSRSGGRGNGSRDKKCFGIAARWNERGFGFIKPEDGSEDVFCHFSAITDGNCLREGSEVEYFVSYDQQKGKYRAENVTGGATEERRGGGGGGGECYAFRDGNCDRGDSCRFSHGSGGGGGGDRYGGGGGRDRYDDRRGGGDRYDDRRGGGDRYDDRRNDRY